jgi:FixJ family two-component response regulator
MMNALPLIRLVDDDAGFRESQKMFLQALGYEVRDWESAVRFLEEESFARPGCILLDILMPEMSGLELQKVLSIRRSDLPVIFLTGHGSIETAVYTMKYGAADFLEKTCNPLKLKETVERACERSVKRFREKQETAELDSVFASLTPREKEVVAQVAEGRSNKEIADSLGIGSETVKMHRANGFAKLGVKSALEAYQWLAKRKEAQKR